MYTNARGARPADRDRLIIADLCRYHRRSMPQVSHQAFASLDAEAQRCVVLLSPLLRLALACLRRAGADKDRLDIEQWHAIQSAGVFTQLGD